jgi:hypothetical protein
MKLSRAKQMDPIHLQALREKLEEFKLAHLLQSLIDEGITLKDLAEMSAIYLTQLKKSVLKLKFVDESRMSNLVAHLKESSTHSVFIPQAAVPLHTIRGLPLPPSSAPETYGSESKESKAPPQNKEPPHAQSSQSGASSELSIAKTSHESSHASHGHSNGHTTRFACVCVCACVLCVYVVGGK